VDAIVNAFNKLREAIHGIQHSRDDAHFKALKQIENTLQPSGNHAIKTVEQVKLPRLEQQTQIALTQHVPWVHFDDAQPTVHDPLPRLVVPSPRKKSLSHNPSPSSNRPSILMSPLQHGYEHDISNHKQPSTNQ
jgi:hypothetical protein